MKSVERNRRGEKRKSRGMSRSKSRGFAFVPWWSWFGVAFTVGLSGRGNFEEIGSVGSVRPGGERAKRIKGVAAVGREGLPAERVVWKW